MNSEVVAAVVVEGVGHIALIQWYGFHLLLIEELIVGAEVVCVGCAFWFAA